MERWKMNCRYLLLRGSAEDLDNLDQLVDAALAGEQRLAQQELSHHTAHRPNVCARIRGAEQAEEKRIAPIALV